MANLRVDKITSTETFETTGSVQFDGSGDRLVTTVSSSPSNSAFTIETWVDFTSSISSGNNTIFDFANATGGYGLFLLLDDGVIKFRYYSDNSATAIGSGIDKDFTSYYNTWVHLATTFDGSTYRAFLNGELIGTISSTTEVVALNRLTIGARSDSSVTQPWLGYISNLRYIAGTALYTANFKPSMRELENIPGTVLLACQSKTDASLEKTGKTITVNGNAVASELTPGILTPVPKAGAGSAITGSVEFDGTGDYLEVDLSTDAIGTDEFTIEMWVNPGETSFTDNRRLIRIGPNNNANNLQILFSTENSNFEVDNGTNQLVNPGITTVATQSWNHIALTRQGTNNLKFFVNGVEDTATTTSADISQTTVQIGNDSTLSNKEFIGYISNLRIVKGTALYTHDFIPPTRELKKVPGTVLLCCQDEDSVTTEATGKTITSNGDPAASNFTPQVGDDRKVTFEGVTKINTENYFYLPTGDTVTRDSRSGRGVNSGGLQPGTTNLMEFVNISTQGNAQDFGDLTINRYGHGSCASSTRGIFAGGWQGSPADYEQSIDSFTIATTGNAIDFGDFGTKAYGMAGCGSNTRGVFSGFRSDSSTFNNITEYITIATLGSAASFGGISSPLVQTGYLAALSSPVRGVFAGGRKSPANYNSIYYVTIASTGNAIDFGDLSATLNQVVGASSNVRGIFGGGYTPSSYPSTVQYITIASTGNAQDFGDVITATRGGSTMSNSNRALFAGGGTPSNQNIINFFTISTTGDATDFGDLTNAARSISALSDSHGGLG